jgi:hypothetical protein
VSEYAAGVSLRRRSSGLSSAEYQASEAADVVENAAVVMLLECIVKVLGALWSSRVRRKAIDQSGQSHLDGRVYQRAVSPYTLADLAYCFISLLLA